jgi:type I restriction enzyme, S subunit
MEMTDRYKKTEVGFIPIEWKVECVGDAFEICNNLRLPISQEARERIHGIYPYYGPTNIQGWINEYRIDGEYALIGEDGDHFLKWKNQSMTLLINGKFNVNNHAHLVRGKENLTAWFYWYFSNKNLTSYLTRQGASRYKISKSTLLKIQCALPPKDEQVAITSCLTDVDALLDSLDRLIAKKRDLKQAAMQQLLTGQTRLQGFSGDWEMKRLGNICKIATGKKDVNEGNPNGQFPFFTCSRSYTYSESYSFDTEAILIAGNGDVGNLHYFNGKFEAYQRTYILYEFKTDVRFLWQQLNAKLADALGLGKIGSSIPYIKKENLEDFEYQSPRESSEQAAIAKALSQMDDELTLLEVRYRKTSSLKQGMMQELLTGKTRLV